MLLFAFDSLIIGRGEKFFLEVTYKSRPQDILVLFLCISRKRLKKFHRNSWIVGYGYCEGQEDLVIFLYLARSPIFDLVLSGCQI